jgi:hypothetical protein
MLTSAALTSTALDESQPGKIAIAAKEARPRRSIPSALAPILLTPIVLFIHGYHPYAGDAGLYVAGIRHILDPSLYPVNAAFVTAFARFSAFPWTMAAIVHLSHLPLSWVLLTAHLLSILLFLTACRQLAARLFTNESARWCSLLLAAACFTLPIAGTALFIMDPCVTARSFSTPLSLMAVAACINHKWPRTILLLALVAALHPLMAAFTIGFVVLHALVASRRTRLGLGLALILCGVAVAAAGLAFALAHRTPILPAYRQAVSLAPRTFLFLARWHWYEDLGLILPLLLFALALRRFGVADKKGPLCLTCLLLGTTAILTAAVFVPAAGPYPLVPLQVLRSFLLIYGLGIVLCGGILGALIARSRVAAVALLVLLFAGMFAAQRSAWAGCNHVEWPGSQPINPYQQAFLWIRDNTPRTAVFAFDPRLVYLPEEDEQGFRAIAQRDHLADDKDAGVAAVIPQLASRWALQRNAELSVDRMTDPDRIAALAPLGANWLLLPPNAKTAFPCPYRNSVVAVCRMT